MLCHNTSSIEDQITRFMPSYFSPPPPIAFSRPWAQSLPQSRCTSRPWPNRRPNRAEPVAPISPQHPPRDPEPLLHPREPPTRASSCSPPAPPVAAAAASAPPRLAPGRPLGAAAVLRSSLAFRTPATAARRSSLAVHPSAIAALANLLRCTHRRAASPRLRKRTQGSARCRRLQVEEAPAAAARSHAAPPEIGRGELFRPLARAYYSAPTEGDDDESTRDIVVSDSRVPTTPAPMEDDDDESARAIVVSDQRTIYLVSPSPIS